MKTSLNGIKTICQFEGCRLKAYKCSAGVWTIGYGNTYYEDGSFVKEGDAITQNRAHELFAYLLPVYESGVNSSVRSQLNQNQFDALVSFTYNVGVGNLKSSTLLKKVNINPNDATIVNEFAKWNKAAKKVIAGLT